MLAPGGLKERRMISGGSDNDYSTRNKKTSISKVLVSITNHENPVYIAIVRYETESQG